MTAHEEKYLEFAAAYALGALDGDELREYEAHLKSGCPVCGAEVTLLMEAASTLPTALKRVSPPGELKERVLEAVRLSERARKQTDIREKKYTDAIIPQTARRPWLAWGLSFVVFVMIVAFSFYYYWLMLTLGEKNEIIEAQSTRIVALADDLQRKNEILRVLESRRIEIVSMDGLKVNPVGYGKIIWDPDRKIAILQVSHLPRVPKGKDYQLWVIKQKEPKPISAGVFAVENEMEMEHYFKVQPLEVGDRVEIGAFAVTLEPKGGVPQPTGEMYLLGKTSVVMER